MNWSETVAFSILLPCGAIYDPNDRLGLSELTCEMTQRGCGRYSSRSFLQTLENLGVESSEGVSHSFALFDAAMMADKLPKVLKMYADMFRRPKFLKKELGSARQVLLQELIAIEDEPARKMGLELSRLYFPAPWGHSTYGTLESLEAMTLDDIKEFHHRFYRPNGAIISVAGRFDWSALCEQIGELFGDWEPLSRDVIVEVPGTDTQAHLESDTNQTHIGLAWSCVPFGHPDYWLASSAINILSGGMSSRLFTEVREKRGLCYSVNASHITWSNRGVVWGYCGTTATRAQESLDVILQEIDKLSDDGVFPEELDRMKIRSKSSLIMEQESTGARARSMARDWFRLGRIMPMKEVETAIDSLDSQTISQYTATHRPGPMRMVTLGPTPLIIPPERLG